MHVLLTPLGTVGDVHPFLGLGAELKARGHRVTLITSGAFATAAAREGLEFCDVMPVAEYEAALGDRKLWDPVRAFWAFYRLGIAPLLRRFYEAVAEQATPGETVVVAPGHALGARIACEKLRLPLVTCHLAPFQFRSAYQNRRLAGVTLPDWMPAGLKRQALRLGDWLSDRVVGPEVNGLRAELGLRPARRIVWEWWNSPRLILALFPAWFAAPQPDWPRQTRLLGFPLYDSAAATAVPYEVEQFVADGPAPIVFTPGTAMAQGETFFGTSVVVCRRLGCRGLLVTRFADQLPPRLPTGVMAAPFVPFAWLLPRAAALVHHGGIGSSSQALAAGIPQLVRPMSMDQPDNAYRLCRLGVAASLRPAAYRERSAARALDRLLHAPAVRQQCRHWAELLHQPAALRLAADQIERLREPEPHCLTGWSR